MKITLAMAAFALLCACTLTPQPVPPWEDALTDGGNDFVQDAMGEIPDVVYPDAVQDGPEAADVSADAAPEDISGGDPEVDTNAEVTEEEPGDGVEIEEGDVEEEEEGEEEAGDDIEEEKDEEEEG